VTNLAELRAELFPGARPLASMDGTADGEAARAPLPVIAWVRVMKARVPAFDALEPGDLAIVPASALAVVAATPEELSPLVGAFGSTPVSGVLLIEGESLAPAATERLAELEAALARAAIPGLRLPAADPAGIERSVIGFILERSGELERQAGLLEADLERRALAGEGPASLVAAAAGFLARPLALEGPRGDVVAVHAPASVGDAAPAVAAWMAGRRDAAVDRVALPSGGALVLLGTRPASQLERVALGRAATLLALELARDEAVRRAGDGGGREALPSGGPPWVVVLARQRGMSSDDDGPQARAAREQLRRELRLLAPARRLALRGDADSLEYRLVLATAAADDRPGGDLPERVAALLGRTVAVSRPFTTAADRPTAEADARATVEAALALPEPPRVARADRLAAYRLLGAMHNVPEGQRLAATILAPILAGRPDVRREHLQTLRAVLERGGINEAAAALGVHRNTVAYRLRRIEAASGWRLTDPDIRLPLAIAVKLMHDDQI
jgi:PucR family transcriptional regulator, purine catabolism regulatory protein